MPGSWIHLSRDLRRRTGERGGRRCPLASRDERRAFLEQRPISWSGGRARGRSRTGASIAAPSGRAAVQVGGSRAPGARRHRDVRRPSAGTSGGLRSEGPRPVALARDAPARGLGSPCPSSPARRPVIAMPERDQIRGSTTAGRSIFAAIVAGLMGVSIMTATLVFLYVRFRLRRPDQRGRAHGRRRARTSTVGPPRRRAVDSRAVWHARSTRSRSRSPRRRTPRRSTS